MRYSLESASRFLSLVLRHEPGSIGLALDAEGWCEVDELVRCANAHGKALTRELVFEIVRTNDKQRFAMSPDGSRIRANQGHSIDVDLKLEPQVPPALLYHGTATRFVVSIRADGLKPGSRRHVHLSATQEIAATVGARHGRPIVLVVDAAAMHADGHAFCRSANGVWLADVVPRRYLRIPDEA